jgi:DNA-binding MarR family transcriptional regulator
MDGEPFGPPLIGALLRMPWEAVQRHMLERLHERGFDDFDAAYLNVFQYPGPQGARPSELAARVRISKQALNYLLGELERLDYLERQPDPDDLRSKRVALTPRGTAAISVIRDAVGEIETTWAQQLGPNASPNSANSCSSSTSRGRAFSFLVRLPRQERRGA